MLTQPQMGASQLQEGTIGRYGQRRVRIEGLDFFLVAIPHSSFGKFGNQSCASPERTPERVHVRIRLAHTVTFRGPPRSLAPFLPSTIALVALGHPEAPHRRLVAVKAFAPVHRIPL